MMTVPQHTIRLRNRGEEIDGKITEMKRVAVERVRRLHCPELAQLFDEISADAKRERRITMDRWLYLSAARGEIDRRARLSAHERLRESAERRKVREVEDACSGTGRG